MMEIFQTEIKEIKIIIPHKNGDERGFLFESYHKKSFSDFGLNLDFVQENHSLSFQKGTIRGLHFQKPPYAQAKLIRVLRGSIFDVAVDIRKNSSTFGKYVTCILSNENLRQIFIPEGFAHGFCTLEENTEVCYKVSNPYSPAYEEGIIWNDQNLNIQWPEFEVYVLSEKDKKWPGFKLQGGFF